MDKNFYTIIAMMSGTSMDGVDACLIKMSEDYDFEIINSYSLSYPKELKKKLMEAAIGNAATSDICFLNFVVGEHFARCVIELLQKMGLDFSDVDFISTHGQTVYHMPNKINFSGYKAASTLQIGDISVIAQRTGIMTIGDFRPKDMAAGGQGAPLVPFADEKIFGRKTNRAIQNIGGISNVTVLSAEHKTFAFDNTVGNMLIDYFAVKFFGQEYDKNGNYAYKGRVDKKWLDELMKDEYLQLCPPKSTGREHFNNEYAERILQFAPENKYDIMRTITEFTAKSIYDSYEKFVFPKVKIEEVIIGGGGAYNNVLMSSLRKYFDYIPVKTHEDFGIKNKLKECLAFAILGLAAYLKRTNNLPECTGASHSVIMGKFSYPD